MKKPLIGVMPLYDDNKDSLWMLPGYFDGIKEAGGIPIMLPLNINDNDIDDLYNICNGFLFTGGHDVDPHLYKEDKKDVCGSICKSRDSLEEKIFNKAYEDDKPILGICRGLQLINVLMGGTLYQDLNTEYSTDINHVMKPPYTNICHNVIIKEHTPLKRILHKEIIGVNSYHHQGIKVLGNNLITMAESEDGLIEGIACKDKRFIWGVQWHPEFNYKVDEDSRSILKEFINNCM